MSLLDKAAANARILTRRELATLLEWPDAHELFAAAYEVKCREIGKRVSLRGLVEFGNICEKDCFYCGIRKSNTAVRRYRMDKDEIVREAEWAFKAGYGSVVLQSGELSGESNTVFVEDVLRRIHAFGGDDFGITISLGEQTEETYRRWREAGAHRYLLRIETSNPTLYARLHPADHSWTDRLECLRTLRRCGYQTGSGVMSGLPGQTTEDLAADIEHIIIYGVIFKAGQKRQNEPDCRHNARYKIQHLGLFGGHYFIRLLGMGVAVLRLGIAVLGLSVAVLLILSLHGLLKLSLLRLNTLQRSAAINTGCIVVIIWCSAFSAKHIKPSFIKIQRRLSSRFKRMKTA